VKRPKKKKKKKKKKIKEEGCSHPLGSTTLKISPLAWGPNHLAFGDD